jgi:hypothetical protein
MPMMLKLEKISSSIDRLIYFSQSKAREDEKKATPARSFSTERGVRLQAHAVDALPQSEISSLIDQPICF